MSGFVMVPLDGSALAEQALPLAASLARRLDDVVNLVRVVPPLPPRYSKKTLQASLLTEELQQTLAQRYLETVERRLEAEGVATVTTVATGDAGETIAELADQQRTDLVVMGTHGYTGAMRWALGSVADCVLRLSTRPLLIFRPRPGQDAASPAPDLARILVSLDGSPLAEQVLPHAVTLARAYGAALVLFRVLPAPVSGLAEAERPDYWKDWYEQERVEATRYLEEHAATLRGAGLTVSVALGQPPAAAAILAHAAAEQVDLIAMTTHGHSKLSRVLLGSVTDRVVRAGERPVLVTRARPQP